MVAKISILTTAAHKSATSNLPRKIHVLKRGTQDKHAVDAAFQTLGPSKAVPAHVLQGQTRSETFNGNVSAGGGAGDAMDCSDATGASNAAVSMYQMNGPADEGVRRTQQTFYDGDSTKQVTTETSQKQFGSTTVTKVRREEVTSSGGWGPGSPSTQHKQVHFQQNTMSSSYPGSLPTFNVSRFDDNRQQPKPGVWSPSGAASTSLTVSAPEGVHVQPNADQSVTMTVGLGTPRQQPAMASPRQNDATSPGGGSSYQPHVRQFNVAKAPGTSSSKPGVWAPGGGYGAPELKPFMVDAPSKWSPTPRKKPTPPETAPKPQISPQPQPEPSYDEYDAVPDPQPLWPPSHLDPSHRDSPIHRIPENPPLIEPLHVSELIRGGEGFSDEDDYLDSPNTRARKKKIYADSSFYDDPEARYPTIEEQIKMARKVALSLMSPANKKARGHKMFMKRLHKSSRWVAGVDIHPEQMEFYLDELDDDPDDKYYNPNPWNTKGHTWNPPTAPKPTSQGVIFRNPVPKPAPAPSYQPSQLPPTMPAAPHIPPPAPYHLPKEEPKPESSFKLAQNPAYKPSIPKPFKPSTADNVPSSSYEDAPDARDSPAFKPSSEFNREYNEEPEIPMAPPPPPPPIPTLSNWATPLGTIPLSDPYGENKENVKKKLNLQDLESARLYGKKNMHNMVSPQVCFSLSDDLRNMKGKGGKLFAKRRARAEQWVVEDKQAGLPGPNSDIRAKILHKVALENPAGLDSPESPGDAVDYSRPSGGPNRLKQLIEDTKSAKSPWEAAASGNMDLAFDHLRYSTVPLRGKKGGGSRSLMDLTGIDTRFTSSNPSAADAAPTYVTATTYHKGRPQNSPTTSTRPASALSPKQPEPKLPDYTRKIQPWSGSAVPSSGPSSAGAVIDWSDPASVSQPGYSASYTPANPDYNRKVKPWRASGNFDHVEVTSSFAGSAGGSGGGGAAYRSVSFKSPSSNFGAFNPSQTASSAPPPPAAVPAAGDPEGFSDL